MIYNSLIRKKNERTLFYDKKTNYTYYINKIIGEHKTNHVRVIYMVAVDGNHKQQFTDFYFFQLLECGQIKEV